jgi:hypothetical protein
MHMRRARTRGDVVGRQRALPDRRPSASRAQEATLPADGASRLLVGFGAVDIVKAVLARANIVVAPELVMLRSALREPGTYNVPLAVLDSAGEQVGLSVRLTPRAATPEELRALGAKSGGAGEGAGDGRAGSGGTGATRDSSTPGSDR